MRNAVLVGAALFVGLLVFLPAGSVAADARLVVTSGIPVKLLGASEFSSPEAVLVARGANAGTFILEGDGFHLERVHIETEYAPVAGIEAMGSRSVSSTLSFLGDDHVEIAGIGVEALLAAGGSNLDVATSQAAADSADVWRDAAAQIGVLVAPASFGPAPRPIQRLPNEDVAAPPGLIDVPAGRFQVDARDAVARLDHVDSLLVMGARLVGAAGETIIAGRAEREAPGSVYVPAPTGGTWTGPGTHRVEIIDYLVLRPVNGILLAEGARVTSYSRDVFVEHEGRVGFPWADGTVETQNETVALGGEQVILGGNLRLRSIGANLDGAPRLTLLGNGDVDVIQVGVQTTRFSNTEAAAAAGGAAAGLGLLAALVYFWPTVKYGLSLALFPLYARVRKEDTLEHKGREVLYELIKNEPGVSTNQLAKDVPFGWSTLTYHLRVLERNEAIVSVRDGRYKRFFDRQSGRFSNGRKYILAVLKNDATLDIARFIREKPGSSQKQVAEAFQLSPSSVHWHVERLSEVELVSKAREAHNVKYYPGEAWSHVTMEDLKSLEGPPASAVVPAPPPPAPDGGPTPASSPM